MYPRPQLLVFKLFYSLLGLFVFVGEAMGQYKKPNWKPSKPNPKPELVHPKDLFLLENASPVPAVPIDNEIWVLLILVCGLAYYYLVYQPKNKLNT